MDVSAKHHSKERKRVSNSPQLDRFKESLYQKLHVSVFLCTCRVEFTHVPPIEDTPFEEVLPCYND